MESKLRSRKFWLVIATFVAGLWATFTETEIDPELLLTYGGVLISWLGIQGWADKAEAASGIGFERRLYQANMEAAMAQFQSMQGQDDGSAKQDTGDVMFNSEIREEGPQTAPYPPLESV